MRRSPSGREQHTRILPSRISHLESWHAIASRSDRHVGLWWAGATGTTWKASRSRHLHGWGESVRPRARGQPSAAFSAPMVVSSVRYRGEGVRRIQASIVRSLSGFEQQIKILFCVISRGRMPPLCCMSTVPESTVVLQVPHMPCPQDDAGDSPAE